MNAAWLPEEVPAQRQWFALRVAGVLVVIATISAFHYLTDPALFLWHEVYERLYYLPVIGAAYWFGPIGGLAAAAVTAIAYAPHIHTAWGDNMPYAASQYAELVVFHLLGLSVGALVSVQRRLTRRYHQAAASLETANRELRESFEQLRRADRLSALGEMAAGLAHEIRNPLTSIKGALEILTARARPDTPEAEFSHLAGVEVARLDGLVNDFLAYARPRDPERRLVTWGEMLEPVLALLQPEGQRLGVTVVRQSGERMPQLLVDPAQVQQVIFNVVLNAIQASPRSGQVHLRQWHENGMAVLEVADEGEGIRAELAARIFDPFFTTKTKGTGLGLAISQRIAAAHGGSIEIRRREPRGTCVHIKLPLGGESEASARTPRHGESV